MSKPLVPTVMIMSPSIYMLMTIAHAKVVRTEGNCMALVAQRWFDVVVGDWKFPSCCFRFLDVMGTLVKNWMKVLMKDFGVLSIKKDAVT